MKNWKLIIVIFGMLVYALTFTVPVAAQQPVPIDQLSLKATHNSYACHGHSIFGGNNCPVINTSPPEQIDDYGVWGLELDFGVEDGILIVGHDGPPGPFGNALSWSDPSWGVTVKDFLIKIKESRAFKEKYRPLFIRFGKKKWGDSDQIYANNVDSNNWFSKLKAILIEVFGEENIFGPQELMDNGWLTVPQLAGKIIPWTDVEYENNDPVVPAVEDPLLFWGDPVLRALLKEGDNKDPVFRENAVFLSPHNTLISQDLHQNDWTFDHTAPPNPIYVVQNAPATFSINNTIGDECSDGTDPGDPFNVSQQGTFKLPFDQVSESVNKALPGWTILIHAGTYPENLTITKPLTLKADGGPVRIGN